MILSPVDHRLQITPTTLELHDHPNTSRGPYWLFPVSKTQTADLSSPPPRAHASHGLPLVQSAEKPSEWLDDEEMFIQNPSSSMPDDWDEEEDGDWEPVMVSSKEQRVAFNHYTPRGG